MLDSVRANLRAALKRQKDQMGFNMAAVRFVKSGVEANGNSEFMDETTFKEAQVRGKKKRVFANLA